LFAALQPEHVVSLLCSCLSVKKQLQPVLLLLLLQQLQLQHVVSDQYLSFSHSFLLLLLLLLLLPGAL
jgi:hypothetical protein